ncbi:ABC transporter substrate-binding protein [Maribrevibacterium harenarium]|uniref:ABC transporter substrate-binding protein n=1 Tax=Maribrevibacterium harenarium TaxID=2589817 RepID=UPI0015E3A2AC|nr:ABC transporter substrate-binding protein [Maribrevibacterium harenarium]
MKHWVVWLLILLGAGQVVAQEKVRLQLKWEHAFQFAGYYAAQELGYYDEAGLQVEIVPAKPGVNVYDEVESGRAEFGVGNSSVLIQRDQGKPFVILAVIFQHSPTVFLARHDVLTLHDWAKKRIMIEPSSDELFLYLEHEGLDTSELQFIPL